MTIETKHTVVAAVASLALLLLAGSVVAGHHGHKGGDYLKADPAKHADKLTEVLSLSDAQAADVEQVLAEAQAERLSIGDRYTLNQRDEAKVEMKALHERTSERIYALLDAEQKQTFDAMMEKRKLRAEHRKEHREMRKKHREAHRGEG